MGGDILITWADIIILIVLAIVVGFVFYFYVIKNKGNPCHGCSKAKQCGLNNFTCDEIKAKLREEYEK